MTDTAITYLRRLEWSMGNGQCPECCGASDDGRWHGHPLYRLLSDLGHKLDCALANSIEELGGEVTYRG